MFDYMPADGRGRAARCFAATATGAGAAVEPGALNAITSCRSIRTPTKTPTIPTAARRFAGSVTLPRRGRRTRGR